MHVSTVVWARACKDQEQTIATVAALANDRLFISPEACHIRGPDFKCPNIWNRAFDKSTAALLFEKLKDVFQSAERRLSVTCLRAASPAIRSAQRSTPTKRLSLSWSSPGLV